MSAPLPRGRLLAALLLLAWTGTSKADPIVTGSATPQGDGSYLYQYTLANPNTGNIALQVFALQGNFDTLTNVNQTSGWGLTLPAPGFYQWSNQPVGQLGNSTANFSFTSTLAPGTVTYITGGPNYAFDPTLPPGSPPVTFGNGGLFQGNVVGPDSTAVTAPEPASGLLLATGGALLLVRRLRRTRAVGREGA